MTSLEQDDGNSFREEKQSNENLFEKEKQKKTKKKQISSVSNDLEAITNAMFRHRDLLRKDHTASKKELHQISNILLEFFESCIILGFTFTGEKVMFVNCSNPRDEAALNSFLSEARQMFPSKSEDDEF